MEAKGEVPKGKKVVRPTAGFVVKTKKLEEGSEIVGSDKVFINVVASTELAEPTSKQEAGGSRWSLPHLLGPPRMERDKKDATASTFDCRAPGPEVVRGAFRETRGRRGGIARGARFLGIYNSDGRPNARSGPSISPADPQAASTRARWRSRTRPSRTAIWSRPRPSTPSSSRTRGTEKARSSRGRTTCS